MWPYHSIHIHEWSSSLPPKYTEKDPLIKILLGFRSYSFNWWISDGYHLIDDSLRSNIWRHISLTKNVSESDQIFQYFPKQLWMIYFEGQPGGSLDKSQLSRLPRLHFRTDLIFLSFIYF